MTANTYFDIETGPLPEEQLKAQMPEFSAPANYRDPDKIKASIAKQQVKRISDGALSAVTGQVLVIGEMVGDCFAHHSFALEHSTIQSFWDSAAVTIRAGVCLVGFCCKTFDLPFLVRRSWALGVKVPSCIWQGPRGYFSDQIVDVAERWACGNRDPRDRISLDTLSKFLGVGQKNGDGKDFAALWASDREKALEYLKNDLLLTKAAYERICQ